MAGPQSSPVPAPARKSTVKPSKKRFTLNEANRSLPLVKRIVADVVTTHTDLTDLQEELPQLAGKTKSAAEAKLEALVDRLHSLVGELTEIGVEIKDFDTGLIDFVGQHRGHDVCLCWQLGEEKVEYFHEIGAGFAGRQSVARLEERA